MYLTYNCRVSIILLCICIITTVILLFTTVSQPYYYNVFALSIIQTLHLLLAIAYYTCVIITGYLPYSYRMSALLVLYIYLLFHTVYLLNYYSESTLSLPYIYLAVFCKKYTAMFLTYEIVLYRRGFGSNLLVKA